MRTDVKIGLLCVFVVILGAVIYFVMAQQSRPRLVQAGTVSTGAESAGTGLPSSGKSGTMGETPAAVSGGLQVSPGSSAAESHGMDLAPASPSVVGQSLAQATPPGGPGNALSGGMIAPPPSPSSPINPTQGTGLASPSTLPGGSSSMTGGPPPLSGGQPISPGAARPLIPSTSPSGSGSTLLGGPGGTLETPRRDIPTPGNMGGSEMGGSGLGGSSRYGSGSSGSSSLGGSNLLGSASSGSGTTHAVEKGDTFGILAKKYGVTIKAIAAANPGVDSTKLKIGKVLNIPAPSSTPASSGSTGSSLMNPSGPTASTRPSRRPTGTPAAAARPSASTGKPGGTYTVKKGDTLGKIAQAVYGDKAAWKKIYQANREQIADADVVTVGEVLKLP